MGKDNLNMKYPVDENTQHLFELVEKSRKDFLRILDSSPAMIWYRDREGKILRANRLAADWVGIEVRQLVGKDYYTLFPKDAQLSRQQDMEVIVTGRPLRGLLREMKTSDGLVGWMSEDLFPLRDDAGKITGIVGFVQDVTEKKLTEERLICAKKEIEIRNEQLRVASEKFRKLAEEARSSNQAKSEILANSSHDLRAPMNAIIGFAELLGDSRLDAEQHEYVQTIHKAATALLSLINDILDFTKLEAGKLDIQIAACNLSDLADDIRAMMETEAAHKGLDLQIRIDPALPEAFFTDSFRLRRCLINLVSNAIKFTREGSVTLSIKPDSRHAQPYVRFDVEDTGIGIPKDKQLQIFESYSQADSATERIYGGTGLGLTITKKLTELMGGAISVVSESGRGSVFSIILPTSAFPAPVVPVSGKDVATSPDPLIEQTFSLDGLMTLLPLLIEELPTILDFTGVKRAAEVSDILDKAAGCCGDEEYRREIRESGNYFYSKPEIGQQSREMIARLEQICREIYEYCRRENV